MRRCQYLWEPSEKQARADLLAREKARAERQVEPTARGDLLAKETARTAPLAGLFARVDRKGEEEAQRAKAKAEQELRQSAQELAEIFGLTPGGAAGLPVTGVQLPLLTISPTLSEAHINWISRG